MFPNEFEYPEERGQLFGEQNEEEAHFYFSLFEFEDILERYGAQFVLARMRNPAFEKLSAWFADTMTKPKEPCALLKKNVS